MRDLYLDKIIDISDPNCEFIEEMNNEIFQFGAIVYNYESNSYQFINEFQQIDYKHELLPDFIKVEDTNELLKALNVTVHYEFDPETEEDEENLDIWNNELSLIELPVLDYDEDGEYFIKETIKMNVEKTKHSIWFLDKSCMNYLDSIDYLMLSPFIKNINIAREIIKNYGINPMKFVNENSVKSDENNLDNGYLVMKDVKN